MQRSVLTGGGGGGPGPSGGSQGLKKRDFRSEREEGRMTEVLSGVQVKGSKGRNTLERILRWTVTDR